MTAGDDHGGMNKHTPYLREYLVHLRRGVAPATFAVYESVLWRAHRALPTGVVAAGEDDLSEWIFRDRWSPSTRRTYLTAIGGLHRWLHRRGVSSYDPTLLLPRVKLPRRLPRPYSAAELEVLLTCTTGPVRLAAHIAAYAGARCLEVIRLHRRDVTAQTIRLYGKGDRERAVPTHPVLWRIVCELPAGPVVTQTRDAHQLSQWCTREFRRLGVDGGLHRLRHTFATMTLAATRDYRAVQELLGHASPATTAAYAAASPESMRAAVAALPDLECSDGVALAGGGRVRPAR